jgi:hypothetical protein
MDNQFSTRVGDLEVSASESKGPGDINQRVLQAILDAENRKYLASQVKAEGMPTQRMVGIEQQITPDIAAMIQLMLMNDRVQGANVGASGPFAGGNLRGNVSIPVDDPRRAMLQLLYSRRFTAGGIASLAAPQSKVGQNIDS